jgi:hypothetical protein
MDLNLDAWRLQRPAISVSAFLAAEEARKRADPPPPAPPEPEPEPIRPAKHDKDIVIARCRLKEAKAWFAHRGWEQLPQGVRGQNILRWGADHAWLAASGNPKRSVRRWCRCWAPWLSDVELNEIVTATETSNKRWSTDQCATVLEISVTHRTRLRLRHIGADDDPFYVARNDIKRARAAERSRRFRAKHRTGAKPGRPPLELSADDRLARRRAQVAESARRRRQHTPGKTH